MAQPQSDGASFQKILSEAFAQERLHAAQRLYALEDHLLSCFDSSLPASLAPAAAVAAAGNCNGLTANGLQVAVGMPSETSSSKPRTCKKSGSVHSLESSESDGTSQAGSEASNPLRKINVGDLFAELNDEAAQDEIAQNNLTRLVDRQLHIQEAYSSVKDKTKQLERGHCLPKAVTLAIRNFMESAAVSTLMVLAIMANAILMGLETDDYMDRIRTGHDSALSKGADRITIEAAPSWMFYADVVFASVFTVELVLRLLGEQVMFLFGDNWLWNGIDTAVVMNAWIEFDFGETGMPPIRVVRMLRMTRSLRLLRAIRFFNELRVILVSLVYSIMPLFWCSIILFLFLFVASLLFVQLLGMHMGDETTSPQTSQDDPGFTVLWPQFSTTVDGTISLFAISTGGIEWHEVYRAFSHTGWINGVLFFCFIVGIVLGMLNVIAALFVESAGRKAKSDKILMQREEHETRQRVSQALIAVFHEIDSSGAQDISSEQWMKFCKSSHGRSFLKLYQVDGQRAHHLFHMLDWDDCGHIDIQQFVIGFMQVQGTEHGFQHHENEMAMRNHKNLLRKCVKKMEELKMHRADVLNNINSNCEIIARQLSTDATRHSQIGAELPTLSVPIFGGGQLKL